MRTDKQIAASRANGAKSRDHLLIGNMLAAHWRKTRLWRRNRQNGDSIGIEENRLDRQFYRAYERYMKNYPKSSPEEPVNDTPVSTCEIPGPPP